jgi:hypothetical protein
VLDSASAYLALAAISALGDQEDNFKKIEFFWNAHGWQHEI